jgi:repressor LexA
MGESHPEWRGFTVEVTRRQKDILDFIRDFRAENDVSPTMDEIASALDLNKKTIYEHLQRLKTRGIVSWRRYEARSLKVLVSDEGRIPFYGYIAAGRPIEAVPLGDSIDISEMLSSDRGSFVLRVKGDSMIDEHIRDGDYVIVERRDHAENGETVVALVDGSEATLKKFYRENGRIRLQPANPSMGPIYARDVQIQGIVIGVVRKYR